MDAAVSSLGALLAELEHDAGAGAPDPAFVRAFAAWLHAKAAHFSFEPVDRLGLRDVVLTFHVRRALRLVVTGTLPDALPGEVTLRIDAGDFDRVRVAVSAAPRPDPYGVCTMDYTLAGTRVRVRGAGPHAGREATLLVAATIGADQRHRVRLDPPRPPAAPAAPAEVDLGGDEIEPLA